MANLFLTTTGTQNPVDIDDLGAISFPHPTNNFDLYTEWTREEISNSADLQAAQAAGHVTLTDEFGNTYDYSVDLFTFSIQSVAADSNRYFSYWAGINSSGGITTNQDLKRCDGARTNRMPFHAPFDGEIIYIAGKHRQIGGSWVGRLMINGVTQHNLTVDNTANSIFKFEDISVAVSQTDLIRLRFSTASQAIPYPQLYIIGKRT